MFRTCAFENIFISPLHLIDTLAGYRILDRKVSPENFERIPLLCSSYTVAVEKCSCAIIGPLSMVCLFVFLSLGVCRMFFLFPMFYI